MSQLKSNVVANFASRAWLAVMSLAFVPLYIKFMGIEAYGLIGLFVSLQALANLFDFGLSATMSREMARYSAQPNKGAELRDLVRTLEVGYWVIGLVIGSLLLVASSFIANTWVKAEQISRVSVQQAVMLMALVLALQWPQSFYKGGLMGLQRQVLCNVINIIGATLQGVGSVLILWLVSPTIQAFFVWQIFTSVLQTGLTAFFIWRCLPRASYKPSFRIGTLRSVWRFAASISIVSITVVLLSQLDKVILSAMLPLELFGYYVLANTVASALAIPPAPISDALFPRYVQLAAQGNEAELRRYFHQGCQLIAGLVFPAASVLIVFSREVLVLWTGDVAIASATYIVASLLALGVALSTLMNVLDVLQMAYGWLKPAFLIRLGALLALGPLMLVTASLYGAIGAAIVWLVIYSVFALITPHFVYRRFLKSEKWRWYFEDMGLPLMVALAVAGLWWMFVPIPVLKPLLLAYLGGVWATSFLVAVGLMPYFRRLIRHMSVRLVGWPIPAGLE